MPASIRASYTKLALRSFRLNYAADWSELSACIGQPTLDTIRAAGSIAWLPAELHCAVADAVRDVYGPRAARVAWRDVMLESFERSLLKPLVKGALGIYGKKPSSIMRMTPQGWSLVWRDCGRAFMEERAEREVWMHFEGLPRVMTGGVIDSFVANCDAALSYVGCRGQVTPHVALLGAGRCDIEVSWMDGNG